jgi:hypothetical protein
MPGPGRSPVKEQVTLKNHPFSMPASGPLYGQAPECFWPPRHMGLVDASGEPHH